MAKTEEKQGNTPVQTISPSPEPPAESLAPADPEIGREISKHLRQLYGKHLAEPLPDKFTVLLEKLARAEKET